MLVSEFDFHLPEELIAAEPRPRGTSRLLVVDRESGSIREGSIQDLPSILAPGDRLVANDTRVFPARLIGRRDPTGGAAECFLVERHGADEWDALVHPGQKLKPGARLVFEDSGRAPGVRITAQILERSSFGRRRVRFAVEGASGFDAAVDALGHVPLPPYIHREDRPEDRERYQTVYARARGSVAAPTAGLHFDEPLVARLLERGIGWTTVTLHVGYGTFKPVRVERVEEHAVDAERFEISARAAGEIASTRQKGGRIVAIGTTTTRTLESMATDEGNVRSGSDETALFIHPGDPAASVPGHSFRVVDALLTNFHLPRSSLLMLVSAFAGRELTRDAYAYAIDKSFRFYSYGDAMLIL
jgi:S-adenosylmethionine:tRNA ribosyltransferase-isomerase